MRYDKQSILTLKAIESILNIQVSQDASDPLIDLVTVQPCMLNNLAQYGVTYNNNITYFKVTFKSYSHRAFRRTFDYSQVFLPINVITGYTAFQICPNPPNISPLQIPNRDWYIEISGRIYLSNGQYYRFNKTIPRGNEETIITTYFNQKII